MSRGEVRLELVEARDVEPTEVNGDEFVFYCRACVKEPIRRRFKRGRDTTVRGPAFKLGERLLLDDVHEEATIVLDLFAREARAGAAGLGATDELLGKAVLPVAAAAARGEVVEWVELISGKLQLRLAFSKRDADAEDDEEGETDETEDMDDLRAHAALPAAAAAAASPSPRSLPFSGSGAAAAKSPPPAAPPPARQTAAPSVPLKPLGLGAAGLGTGAPAERAAGPPLGTHRDSAFVRVVSRLSTSVEWTREVLPAIRRSVGSFARAARSAGAQRAQRDAHSAFQEAAEGALQAAIDAEGADSETILTDLLASADRPVPPALDDVGARTLRLLWCMDDMDEFDAFMRAEASAAAPGGGDEDDAADNDTAPVDSNGTRADNDTGIDHAAARDMLGLGIALGLASGELEMDAEGRLSRSRSPHGSRSPSPSPTREGRVFADDRFEELPPVDVDVPVVQGDDGDGRPPRSPSRRPLAPPTLEAIDGEGTLVSSPPSARAHAAESAPMPAAVPKLVVNDGHGVGVLPDAPPLPAQPSKEKPAAAAHGAHGAGAERTGGSRDGDVEAATAVEGEGEEEVLQLEAVEDEDELLADEDERYDDDCEDDEDDDKDATPSAKPRSPPAREQTRAPRAALDADVDEFDEVDEVEDEEEDEVLSDLPEGEAHPPAQRARAPPSAPPAPRAADAHAHGGREAAEAEVDGDGDGDAAGGDGAEPPGGWPEPVETRTSFRYFRDVTVSRFDGELNGAHVEVQDLNNCEVLLLDVSAQVTIDRCTNCRFLIAPTNGSVFVRDCKSCMLTVACRQLRTRGCMHCDIFVHTLGPIVETSSGMRFERWNVWYPGQDAHFARAKLDAGVNKWNDVYDFSEGDGAYAQPHWELMPAAEFLRWEVRFDGPHAGRLGGDALENAAEAFLPAEYLDAELEESSVQPPPASRFGTERAPIGKRLVDGAWTLIYEEEAMATKPHRAPSSGQAHAEPDAAPAGARDPRETELALVAAEPGWVRTVHAFVANHAPAFSGEGAADRARQQALHEVYAAAAEVQLEETLAELGIDAEAFLRALLQPVAPGGLGPAASRALLQVRAMEDLGAFVELMEGAASGAGVDSTGGR